MRSQQHTNKLFSAVKARDRKLWEQERIGTTTLLLAPATTTLHTPVWHDFEDTFKADSALSWRSRLLGTLEPLVFVVLLAADRCQNGRNREAPLDSLRLYTPDCM